MSEKIQIHKKCDFEVNRGFKKCDFEVKYKNKKCDLGCVYV